MSPRKKRHTRPPSSAIRKRKKKVAAAPHADTRSKTVQAARRRTHEMPAHQPELELQNKALRKTEIELAESRDRYSELYELSPIGYLTLGKHGRILESNVTAAKILGAEPQTLLRENFSKFVSRPSQNDWHAYRQATFSSKGKQKCEIEMRTADGSPLSVRLEGVVFGSGNDRRCRTAIIDITQTKQAEDALRELTKTLERRVRRQTAQIRVQAEAIAHLAEGVTITNGSDWMESRFVSVNEASCRITGYTAGELMGRPRSILTGAETDRETLHRIQRDLSKGKAGQAELILYRKDGTPYNAEVSITPLRSGGRRPAGFVTIHRDITERKRASQAIEESEQRFRRMADHAPVMIWMSDTEKSCTWCNKPWLEFRGRTMDQEMGNGWTEGVHPDDLALCLETYSTHFDTREPFDMEYRTLRRDGEWRWLFVSGNPQYDGNGAFAGYIGSCIDVTERRQAENSLREREVRLQAILDTASDSIITIDRNEIITDANPATERIFGYRRDELLGRNISILSPAYKSDHHHGYIARYLLTGKTRMIGAGREMVGLRKDGSTFPVELAVSEIEHLGLYMGIHRDITARKQSEKELEQYRKDLRTMSSELMLAEERQKQRLAQDLHDGLGQALFRARMKLDRLSIAHPAVGEVTTILGEVGKMVNTLTFELSPPVLRLLGLRPAISWLVQDMKQRYELSVKVDDDGRDSPLDERIRLVLFRSIRELLINVAKHAQTDQATLALRRRDQTLQIEIEDRGKGFDPAQQSRQVESGRFGLFSIRERLEYLQGSFKIRSAPGKGARVTLTVPLEAEKTRAAAVNETGKR